MKDPRNLGKTPAGTDIRLVRSDSLGLRGTYRNIGCHAEALRHHVALLEPLVQTIPFKSWLQGHNTHIFVTHDHREFRFRPLYVRGSFIGLELSMSKPVRQVLLQFIDIGDLLDVVKTLQLLAKPQVRNEYTGIPQKEREAWQVA